jgi:spore coat polysaccharide biosynthesis protein SpsF (cytidylyltransferase family)
VVAIVQARIGSTRLPGKSLMDVAGCSLLGRVLARTGRIDGVDRVVVATTTSPEDAEIVAEAERHGCDAHRGHATDVLDRYRAAARAERADVIVRVTADCPLLDPEISGQVVRQIREGGVDYVSNVDPPTFPDGLDTEAITREALETAWREALDPSDREHVTLFIRQRRERFRAASLRQAEDWSHLRWTVDEPADLEFVRAVYEALAVERHASAGLRELSELMQRDPRLRGMSRTRTRGAVVPGKSA